MLEIVGPGMFDPLVVPNIPQPVGHGAVADQGQKRSADTLADW